MNSAGMDSLKHEPGLSPQVDQFPAQSLGQHWMLCWSLQEREEEFELLSLYI